MRTAVYYSNSDIRLEERPVPEIGAGEALIRIEASGICGTDVLEWYRIHRAPLILGHEVAGVVEAVGDEVAALCPGDRIVAAHHVPCNTCHYCLTGRHTVCETLRTTNFFPGGFAEFVRLPAINVDRGVFPLPEEVSFEEGTFVEPLACVLRGQRVAGMKAGLSVLVLGSGISGALHIALAKAVGAEGIFATDISGYRLDLARRFGADEAFYAEKDAAAAVRAANGGRGADLVIIATGAPAAIAQAFEAVDRAGTILFFAPTKEGYTIPAPINDIFWRNEAKLVSTYAASPSDHIEALELIAARRLPVGDMITHRLPLSQTQDGFRLVCEADRSLKVIVLPSATD